MFIQEHNPPHFHVRYNEYRALVDIRTGELTGNPPRRVITLVYEWLDEHQEELMENWQRIERGEELKRIEPLD